MDAVTQLRRLLAGMVQAAAAAGDDHHAAMLELLRHGTDERVAEPLLASTTIWRDYSVRLIQDGQASGHLRSDIDATAVAGLIIEVSVGVQTRTPLPEGLACQAAAQLVRLLTSPPARGAGRASLT